MIKMSVTTINIQNNQVIHRLFGCVVQELNRKAIDLLGQKKISKQLYKQIIRANKEESKCSGCLKKSNKGDL